MLVHKASLGVLNWIWNDAGTVLVPASFRTCPEASPDEWWEIDSARQRRFAARVARYYPDFTPILDGAGQLIDIEPFVVVRQRMSQVQEKKRLEAIKEKTARHGYTRAYSLRPRENALPFLAEALIARARYQT